MAVRCMEPATMSEEQFEKMQDLAEDLEANIMALEPRCEWADLDQSQLDRLQSLEKELGVILLAYT